MRSPAHSLGNGDLQTRHDLVLGSKSRMEAGFLWSLSIGLRVLLALLESRVEPTISGRKGADGDSESTQDAPPEIATRVLWSMKEAAQLRWEAGPPSFGRCAQVRFDNSCASPEPLAHERDMPPRFGTYLAPRACSADAAGGNQAGPTARYKLVHTG